MEADAAAPEVSVCAEVGSDPAMEASGFVFFRGCSDYQSGEMLQSAMCCTRLQQIFNFSSHPSSPRLKNKLAKLIKR